MLIPFQQLFAQYNVKTNGILHIGANEGQEAETYAALGVSNVIWVEALPDVYQRLVARLADLKLYHPALRACVSDVDGQEVTFHVASNDGQSSSMLEPTLHKEEHPTVKFNTQVQLKTTRMDTLLRQTGLVVGPDWFLNIDLQGAEMLALRGMGEFIHQFKYAYLEVNNKELYRGCPLVHEIDDYLETFGFQPRASRWTGNGWGDKFYSK